MPDNAILNGGIPWTELPYPTIINEFINNQNDVASYLLSIYKTNPIIKDKNGNEYPILSFVSNATTFNFSFRTLINGQLRTVSLTDENGNLQHSIELEIPENIVNVFVNHESKKNLLYSTSYHNCKLLISRLVQERKYLSAMLKDDNETEETEKVIKENKEIKPKQEKEKTPTIPYMAFECVVDEPTIVFTYIKKDKDDDYKLKIEKLQNGINSKLEMLRFVSRMIEFSWAKSNPYNETIEGIKYDEFVKSHSFKFPGKRIEWIKLNYSLDDSNLYCRYHLKQIKKKDN